MEVFEVIFAEASGSKDIIPLRERRRESGENDLAS
jgi:hypothetical protein